MDTITCPKCEEPYKICCKCRKPKPPTVESFGVDKSTPDGLNKRCRWCRTRKGKAVKQILNPPTRKEMGIWQANKQGAKVGTISAMTGYSREVVKQMLSTVEHWKGKKG